MRIRFLDCVLDTEARSLTRRGAEVHLTTKAFELLAFLVRERPRAVPKSELLDTVWPGTFVTDASLARTVHEIRGAIGETVAGDVIRTVHRHGYAFVAEAEVEAPARHEQPAAPAPSAEGWLVNETHAIALADGTMLVGRDPAADIPLESPQASWHHARLIVSPGVVMAEDLGSKNGTRVNGKPITGPTQLRDTEGVWFGTVRFIFRAGEKQASTLTVARE